MQITGQFIPLVKDQNGVFQNVTKSDIVTEIEDSALWTNYSPLRIPCEIGDVIGIDDNGNQQFYVQKSSQTIAAETAKILEETKKNKIDQVQALYNQYQIVKLVDSVEIYYPLKGSAYSLLKDRILSSDQTGLCNIEIIDIYGNIYQAKDALGSKRIPYIFINALFIEINEVSENNRLALTPLIGNSDFGTIGKIQKSSTLEELNAININVFTTPEAIDLDDLINNYYSKTDQELLADGYLQFHIDIFRTWKENLIINSDNKYQIFEKINI